MSLLLDTNVVLDVLAERQPFFADSAGVMTLVEQGATKGYLCSTTLTTLFYICRQSMGGTLARNRIRTLLNLFEVAPVNRAVLADALMSSFADFEDAVLHEAARHAGCSAIITRNTADFIKGSLRIHTPTQYLQMWRATQNEPAPRYGTGRPQST